MTGNTTSAISGSWLNGESARKILLWLLPSLALSVIFFRSFWTTLPTMLSPDFIFGQFRATPVGVLALCVIFLWLKKKEILSQMRLRLSPLYVVAGLALVAAAIGMPSHQDFVAFQVVLASLGVFVILFGKAARIPSILVAVYGFAISFPELIKTYAESEYSQTSIVPVMSLLHALGYPIGVEGQWVRFMSSTGEAISVTITSACAGPATMSVFLSIFVLMMMDSPLPPRKAVVLFLVGVVGTWLQSNIRLIILMLLAYHLGSGAMWAAHKWTIYGLFPLWYLLFAYIYFRQLEKVRSAVKKKQAQQVPAPEKK
ncbi:MAG: archaeosortase/exosortase family protein [Chloroflexi bacterium]|nr:archaeosortase/exosortase family protein [Chloroflexota bacterium]